MKIKHVLLATLVAAIWGLSFIVVAIGLRDCPPLLLAALRFVIVFLAGVLMFPRPTLPWRLYIKAGFCLGVIQFACLFSAIHLGVPAGIVSVIVQMQVFITLLLSGAVLRESTSWPQRWLMAVAFLGVLLLGYARYRAALPMLPLCIALLGAVGFAWGNIILKRVGKVDMFAFTVRMSIVPPLPLLILSVLLEGGSMGLVNAMTGMSLTSLCALFFLALIGTLFALGTWGKLLTLYPAAQVAPFSLLSPVFGLLGGCLILGERYDAASIGASCLIVFALLVNTWWSRIGSSSVGAASSAISTSKS